MKASAVLCAVLAGTFGFSTIASAQQWRGDRDHDRDRGGRYEQHHDRGDRGWDHDRGERRRGDHRWERHERREWRRHEQPRYVYGNPGHRYYRGGYLPRAYLGGPYYVSNWNAYPGLYAPPYGYQWVRVGNDVLLTALATGVVLDVLYNIWY